MMLIEQTTVPSAALPVMALKYHLRLGTGFADDEMQDGLMESYLRAAMAAIEGRIGKVLISREYKWSVEDWRTGCEQALPVAPVSSITQVTMLDRDGLAEVVPAEKYRLVQDMHRPKLRARGYMLPSIPTDGRVEIEFVAGFGPAWNDVPSDLGQAVLLLAAEYYERRHEGGLRSNGGLPLGVITLIERWRTVRVLGGAGA
ncbi:hypothetical protein EOK75_01535 [Pseudorhodobacter turbinis]|uniref:Phage gp6-like head-tail connector protein n=1 Tax=Pseudorhodobacter turbinis TaxID=2500533 RepID=A0A4P8ED55_9RHOB|nr:hypothetical protein [Pseudorhodobacter turbinis]QCO54603.1 hypothetical protein EOK75_01535 [Pseudorhodobacter turbinis]